MKVNRYLRHCHNHVIDISPAVLIKLFLFDPGITLATLQLPNKYFSLMDLA